MIISYNAFWSYLTSIFPLIPARVASHNLFPSTSCHHHFKIKIHQVQPMLHKSSWMWGHLLEHAQPGGHTRREKSPGSHRLSMTSQLMWALLEQYLTLCRCCVTSTCCELPSAAVSLSSQWDGIFLPSAPTAGSYNLSALLSSNCPCTSERGWYWCPICIVLGSPGLGAPYLALGLLFSVL